jgi:hypothetical protein
VLRGGKQISEVDIINFDIQVYTGIAYTRQLPMNVPFYEEHEVRKDRFTEKEWMALMPMERAMEVAHYRVNQYIDLHETDARESDRKSKAK